MANISLLEFYRRRTAEQLLDSLVAGRPRKKEEVYESIYWRDEMDFYIVADYYGTYLGGKEDWTKADIAFMKCLGFSPDDFDFDS